MPMKMWARCAQSPCICRRGAPSPGADVGEVLRPVPVQMWARWAHGLRASVTINGPRSEPPMPMLTMSVIFSPVWPIRCRGPRFAHTPKNAPPLNPSAGRASSQRNGCPHHSIDSLNVGVYAVRACAAARLRVVCCMPHG